MITEKERVKELLFLYRNETDKKMVKNELDKYIKGIFSSPVFFEKEIFSLLDPKLKEQLKSQLFHNIIKYGINNSVNEKIIYQIHTKDYLRNYFFNFDRKNLESAGITLEDYLFFVLDSSFYVKKEENKDVLLSLAETKAEKDFRELFFKEEVINFFLERGKKENFINFFKKSFEEKVSFPFRYEESFSNKFLELTEYEETALNVVFIFNEMFKKYNKELAVEIEKEIEEVAFKYLKNLNKIKEIINSKESFREKKNRMLNIESFLNELKKRNDASILFFERDIHISSFNNLDKEIENLGSILRFKNFYEKVMNVITKAYIEEIKGKLFNTFVTDLKNNNLEDNSLSYKMGAFYHNYICGNILNVKTDDKDILALREMGKILLLRKGEGNFLKNIDNTLILDLSVILFQNFNEEGFEGIFEGKSIFLFIDDYFNDFSFKEKIKKIEEQIDELKNSNNVLSVLAYFISSVKMLNNAVDSFSRDYYIKYCDKLFSSFYDSLKNVYYLFKSSDLKTLIQLDFLIKELFNDRENKLRYLLSDFFLHKETILEIKSLSSRDIIENYKEALRFPEFSLFSFIHFNGLTDINMHSDNAIKMISFIIENEMNIIYLVNKKFRNNEKIHALLYKSIKDSGILLYLDTLFLFKEELKEKIISTYYSLETYLDSEDLKEVFQDKKILSIAKLSLIDKNMFLSLNKRIEKKDLDRYKRFYFDIDSGESIASPVNLLKTDIKKIKETSNEELEKMLEIFSVYKSIILEKNLEKELNIHNINNDIKKMWKERTISNLDVNYNI